MPTASGTAIVKTMTVARLPRSVPRPNTPERTNKHDDHRDGDEKEGVEDTSQAVSRRTRKKRVEGAASALLTSTMTRRPVIPTTPTMVALGDSALFAVSKRYRRDHRFRPAAGNTARRLDLQGVTPDRCRCACRRRRPCPGSASRPSASRHVHLVADGLDDDVVLAGDDDGVGDSLVVADGRQSPSDFPAAVFIIMKAVTIRSM